MPGAGTGSWSRHRRGARPLPAGARIAFLGHSFVGRGGFCTLSGGNPQYIASSNLRGDFAWLRLWDARFNLDMWANAAKPDLGSVTDGYLDGAYQGLSGCHLIDNGGLSGTIARTSRLLSLNPDIVVVDVGVNDINSSISDSATLIARMETQIALLLDAGKRVVWITPTDRGVGASGGLWPGGDGRRTWLRDAIDWLKSQDGRGGGRFRVCDISNLGFNADGAGGFNAALFGADQIHPNPRGGRMKAGALLPVLQAMVQPGATYDPDPAAGNLWPAYSLKGTAGTRSGASITGTVATGYIVAANTGTTGVACSKETIDANYDRQVLTFTPVNDGTANRIHVNHVRAADINLATAGVAAGQWLEAFVHVELNAWAGWLGFNFVFEVYNGGTFIAQHSGGLNNPDAAIDSLPLESGGFAGWIPLTRFQAPTYGSPTIIRLSTRPIQFQTDKTAAGTGIAKISRPILRKVTSPITAWS